MKSVPFFLMCVSHALVFPYLPWPWPVLVVEPEGVCGLDDVVVGQGSVEIVCEGIVCYEAVPQGGAGWVRQCPGGFFDLCGAPVHAERLHAIDVPLGELFVVVVVVHQSVLLADEGPVLVGVFFLEFAQHVVELVDAIPHHFFRGDAFLLGFLLLLLLSSFQVIFKF